MKVLNTCLSSLMPEEFQMTSEGSEVLDVLILDIY